jgi:hypothetical protein
VFGGVNMKKREKAIFVGVCLIVATLMVNGMANDSKNPNVVSNDAMVYPQKALRTSIVMRPTVKSEALSYETCTFNTMSNLNGDIQVTDSGNDELHPALAVSSDGSMLILYENQISQGEGDIEASLSSDGQIWNFGDVFEIPDLYESYPCIDIVSDRKAVGTWTPDPIAGEAGGVTYIAEFGDITDHTTWTAISGDFGIDFAYFQSVAIAGYGLPDKPNENFEWVWACTCDLAWLDYEDDHTYAYSWRTEDGGIVIYPGDVDPNYNAYNISADIDQSTGTFYMIMEGYYENDPSKVRIRGKIKEINPELGEDWYWIQGQGLDFILPKEQAIHPDVSAAGGTAYIVAEQIDEYGNHNIICSYSSNDGKRWEVSFVADTTSQETNPSVIAYPGGKATCSYMIDSVVYVSHTIDGGVSWSTPIRVSDSSSVVEGYRAADIAEAGHMVWMDNRTENTDIYYDNIGYPPAPIINIESISGGLGIAATITNVGTADAENIDYSIVLDGQVFIGEEKNGRVTIPAGGEATIKNSLVFGIGLATIEVYVDGITKTASCRLLGPLVLGVR